MGLFTRFTRSAVLEVLGNDYVRTARAKGLPERVVILRHVLRAASPPVVTVIGLAFGNVMTGTVLVVTDKFDDNIFLASRNLPGVLVLEAREVDPVSLVRFDNVLLTKAAVAQFEEILA
jgi:ABC-type microcin C transport system permease subunit YejE